MLLLVQLWSWEVCSDDQHPSRRTDRDESLATWNETIKQASFPLNVAFSFPGKRQNGSRRRMISGYIQCNFLYFHSLSLLLLLLILFSRIQKTNSIDLTYFPTTVWKFVVKHT